MRSTFPIAVVLALTSVACADEAPPSRPDLPAAEPLEFGCEPSEPEAADLEGDYTLFLINTEVEPAEIARFDARAEAGDGLLLELTPLPPALDAYEPVGEPLPPIAVSRGSDGVFTLSGMAVEVPAASLEERSEPIVVEADFEGVHCGDSPAWRGNFDGTIVAPEEEPLSGVWYLVR